jgi:hypothetical protein
MKLARWQANASSPRTGSTPEPVRGCHRYLKARCNTTMRPVCTSVSYASDEFLLATKLVAQRRKDAADIVTLAKRLQMEHAPAADLEELIHRYYTDEDSLEFIVGGNDIGRELHLLAVRAEQLLANSVRR